MSSRVPRVSARSLRRKSRGPRRERSTTATVRSLKSPSAVMTQRAESRRPESKPSRQVLSPVLPRTDSSSRGASSRAGRPRARRSALAHPRRGRERTGARPESWARSLLAGSCPSRPREEEAESSAGFTVTVRHLRSTAPADRSGRRAHAPRRRTGTLASAPRVRQDLPPAGGGVARWRKTVHSCPLLRGARPLRAAGRSEGFRSGFNTFSTLACHASASHGSENPEMPKGPVRRVRDDRLDLLRRGLPALRPLPDQAVGSRAPAGANPHGFEGPAGRTAAIPALITDALHRADPPRGAYPRTASHLPATVSKVPAPRLHGVEGRGAPEERIP